MQQKGYYIFFGSNSSGVIKKIDNQLEEIRKYCEVELITVEQKKRSFARVVYSCLPWVEIGFDYDCALEKMDNPTFVYVRRMTADSGYVDFFKKIKDCYPLCKVIVEIPTYPYFRDSYAHNFKHFVHSFPYYIKDVIYTRKLKKIVDRVLTFSNDESIYGVKTIRTGNGIKVEGIPVSQSKYDPNKLNLISVAMYANHHGYERVIRSMGEYYKNGGKRNLLYYCVGFGAELDKYRKLVETYKLEDHVCFTGPKSGKELDEIFNKAHIGLDFFGAYKEGIHMISSLKTIEYISRGLPVATAVSVNVFQKYPCDFYIQFKNDASNISINELVHFYDTIYQRNNLHEAIREYAKNTVDNSVVMESLIQFILN